jgi:protein SCO1/2
VSASIPRLGRERASAAVVLFAALLLAGGCKKKDEAFELMKPPVNAQSLQRYWTVPDFQLIERSGQPVSHADLRGKVWVADFFYTTCPGPCPMLTSRLSELQAATSKLPAVRLISISTDPAKDTPEVLKKYAEKFEAGENWLFLTGKKETIFDLANKGFKLAVVEDGTVEEPITHSTKLVLVDQTGMIRGFYEGVGEGNTQSLVADIERLLRERP